MRTNHTPDGGAEPRQDERPGEAGGLKALQASETRYRRAFESAQDGILILDAATGMVVDVNPFLLNLLGYTREAFLTRKVWELGFLNVTIADEDTFREFQAKDYIRDDDLLLETSDGGHIQVEFVSNVYLVNEHRMIQCNFRDITERMRAEDALRESEERFHALMDDIETVAVQGYGPDGVTQYWNKASERLYGYTQQEAIGCNLLDLIIPPEMKDDVKIAIRTMAESGHPIPSGELLLMHKDGSRVPVLSSHTVVRVPGREQELFCLDVDITELKQAESELRRLSTAIEQSPETVVITDTEGTIQYVNPAFKTTTGYTFEEAIGQNPRILNSGQQDDEFYTAMWSTLLEGRVWKGRLTNQRKDGSFYIEEASITPVKDRNGTITNYVAVKRDITAELERENMLRHAQKMESVGRLAGGVAHDFNNMLQIILGHSDMALEQVGPDSPLRADLEEIRNAGRRSADLTSQLLAFARKQTIAPKVLDLNDAVVGMLKMLRRLIGEGIDLAWKPGAELWSVKLDPGQVDQLLANLCINARDAIDGVGKVTIKTANVSIDAAYCAEHVEATIGSYVMLVVSDDGCGMDKETLAQVFEPFFTTKGVGQGTGLGLSTVYGIVKQNEGFVNVCSEPGEGTTFRIYLPRFVSEDAGQAEEHQASRPVGGRETVMLVEDEKSVLVITARFLELLGYTVLTADTPSAALRLAAEHGDAIELLITDVVMPGMSGRDLAAKLTGEYPRMKCLFISGYTADLIVHRGILEEGVHYLSKPFTQGDIAHKVREILNDKQATRQ